MNNAYLDHDWYQFRALGPLQEERPAMAWPHECKAVIHLAVCLQTFPLALKPPMAFPGMLDRPYPDITNWSQRKVALREGLERLSGLVVDEDLPTTFVVESDALNELAAFMPLLKRSTSSVVAGGVNAATLHSGFLDDATEQAAIASTLRKLGDAVGRPVDAWRSPSGVHSPRTLNLLHSAGVRVILDFNNDELPFGISTKTGPLLGLPWQHFSSDLHCLNTCKQPTSEYLHDLTEGIRWLVDESDRAGIRVQTIPVHPWILCAPHRFRLFAEAVRQWKAIPGVAFLNSDQMASAYSRGLPQ